MSVDIRVIFEVFGKVQKVFFRKYTEIEAKRLGLTGWCENSATGTVRGELEGDRLAVEEMKRWLSKIGSPKSRIDRCVFIEEVCVQKKYTVFGIRK